MSAARVAVVKGGCLYKREGRDGVNTDVGCSFVLNTSLPLLLASPLAVKMIRICDDLGQGRRDGMAKGSTVKVGEMCLKLLKAGELTGHWRITCRTARWLIDKQSQGRGMRSSLHVEGAKL